MSPVRLSYPKAKRRLKRWTWRSTKVPQRRIYRSRRKGCRCKPSNLAFSTTKRMSEVKYLSSLTYLAEELCISSVTLQRKFMEGNSCQILTIGDQYY
ncbi:hypothetical protein B296_00024481 [Ensete ventricosum]|uniref:Uncharacterized protein n=1 Tax=Ensete ventricosum TaxID=4639 RepID=A0A426YGR9_ENSVE|nr:hypothetical protein B296_00024481 [Ensete ventricosum]